jgi:hypothetical protein
MKREEVFNPENATKLRIKLGKGELRQDFLTGK